MLDMVFKGFIFKTNQNKKADSIAGIGFFKNNRYCLFIDNERFTENTFFGIDSNKIQSIALV
jgi:hypothetical protein